MIWEFEDPICSPYAWFKNHLFTFFNPIPNVKGVSSGFGVEKFKGCVISRLLRLSTLVGTLVRVTL